MRPSLPLALVLLAVSGPLLVAASYGDRHLRHGEHGGEDHPHHHHERSQLGESGHGQQRWPALDGDHHHGQMHHDRPHRAGDAPLDELLPTPSRGIDDDDNGAGSLTYAFASGEFHLGYALQDAASDVATAVLPGSVTASTVDAVMSPISTSATTDCTAPAPGLTAFVTNGLTAWANLFNATAVSAATSGSFVAGSIISPAAIAELQSFFTPFSVNASVAGAGVAAGWGMSIQCQGTVLLRFGGGAAGGIGSGKEYSGAGAGGRLPGATSSVGGAGTCSATSGGSLGCQGQAASDSSSSLQAMAASVATAANACPSGGLALCGNTGIGGSITYPATGGNAACAYAATMSISLAAPLRATAPVTCSADSTTDSISVAVQACTLGCDDAPDFYYCYCPCFTGKVASLGHTWAAAITCPTA